MRGLAGGVWSGAVEGEVPVAGGVLPVALLGDAGAPALLMLHGWTLDRRMWALQAGLARDFRLVAFDRRGFGGSTAPADLAAEPDDVLAVADALGLARFHLLGTSQGGKVALAAAERASAGAAGRVLSVIVQGSALDGVAAPDEAVPLAAMRADMLRGDRLVMRARWAGHPLTQVAAGPARALLGAMLAEYDGRDLLSAGRPLRVGADVVARIGAPVLALVGAGDTPQRRANADALAAAGATMRVLPGGHLCAMERPAAFDAAVLDFAGQARALA